HRDLHRPSFPTRRSSDLQQRRFIPPQTIMSPRNLRFNKTEEIAKAFLPLSRKIRQLRRAYLLAVGTYDMSAALCLMSFSSPLFLDRKSTRLNSSHVSISY